jgi:hypothetical protein
MIGSRSGRPQPGCLVRQKDGRRNRYQIQAHYAGHVISGYASQAGQIIDRSDCAGASGQRQVATQTHPPGTDLHRRRS